MRRKPKMIHNALLPNDSTFPTSPSSVRRTLANSTAVYARIHWPNGTWPEGIIRARGGSMPYKVNVDGQTLVHHHKYLCPLCVANSSNLGTGPPNIIFNVLENNGTQEVQPSNPATINKKLSSRTFHEIP
ncbi:unnamed protein product [Hymenolepis diminuta]|nr:unnamed protein product [Hymenolepis diminuta]